MRFDAVLFDSGGTLYDPDYSGGGAPTAEQVAAGAGDRVRAALLGLGHRVDECRLGRVLEARAAAFRAGPGRTFLVTFEQLMAEVLADLGLPARPEEAAYLAGAWTGIRYRQWLFPGTEEMLRRLADAGLVLGVVANTCWPGWAMDRAFRAVGIGGHLAVRVYSGDEGVAKPDERIYRLAEARGGLAGRRVLFVGDSLEKDIRGPRCMGWAAALRISAETPSSGGEADFEFRETSALAEYVLGG